MIYLSKPYFDRKELKAVWEVFKSGWAAGQGPKGLKLAQQIKKFLKLKYAIPVNNCTAGLHLALLSLNIKDGDEVLVSDFTFPASGHAVMYCRATPRFIDVNLQTYNLDPALLEEKINKKTRAIIVVHALGQMAQMDKIMSIAKKYNLKVIEDAACAMGSTYKGKKAGTYGDISVFSLHARKNATSGEGGIIVTDNKQYAETMTSLSNFGMDSAYHRQKKFKIPRFEKLGYNYKLSDINSAIAIEQLKKYPRFLQKKRKLANLYNRILAKNKKITVPAVGEFNDHIYQTYAIVLDKSIDRNKLIIALKKDDIQTQIGTYSSHLQPVYQNHDNCPNSLFLFRHTLALPLYFEMTEKQILYVAERLNYHMQQQRHY